MHLKIQLMRTEKNNFTCVKGYLILQFTVLDVIFQINDIKTNTYTLDTRHLNIIAYRIGI